MRNHIIKPKGPLLVGVGVLLCIAVLQPFWSMAIEFWAVLACALLLVASLDFFILLAAQAPQVTRTVAKNLPINTWVTVSLRIQMQRPPLALGQTKMFVFDHHFQNSDIEGMPQTRVFVKAISGEAKTLFTELVYKIKPKRRGEFTFLGTDVQMHSPLRLWRRTYFISAPTPVKIYPNFADVADFAMLAAENKLTQLGVHKKQRRGEGQDFLQLREYRRGDSVKHIDWKATARHQKMITREFQDERDQQIIFLLDCGRRMRHSEHGQEHLDQSLNAMLLLSYVATHHGDGVGFLSFAGHKKWCAPRKGAHTVSHLLDSSYDLTSTTDTADYLTVARELMSLQKKRSMIILMTNTRDEDHEDLKQALAMLSKKHLVVLADLLEEEVEEKHTEPVNTFDDALLYQSVLEYTQRRRNIHALLQHQGAVCINTTAKNLPIKLVNNYFNLKHSGRF